MKRIVCLGIAAILVFGFCIAVSSAEELPTFTAFGEYKKQPPYKIGFAFHGGGISWDIQCINAFKHVPVTIALWQGDAEFAPEGNVMFDSTISDYLTNDDIHTLCENIAWKLVRLLKTEGDRHTGKAAKSKKR